MADVSFPTITPAQQVQQQVQQDQGRVVPRNIFTGGKIPANTIMRLGNTLTDNAIVIDPSQSTIDFNMLDTYAKSGKIRIIDPNTTGSFQIYGISDGVNYGGFISALGTGSAQNSSLTLYSTVTAVLGGANSSGNVYLSTSAGQTVNPNLQLQHVGYVGAVGNDYTFSRSFYPAADNTFSLGDASLRWSLIRGVTITAGDLAFEERFCYKTGLPFEVGDELCLIAIVTDEKEGFTRTVPVLKHPTYVKIKRWLRKLLHK